MKLRKADKEIENVEKELLKSNPKPESLETKKSQGLK